MIRLFLRHVVIGICLLTVIRPAPAQTITNGMILLRGDKSVPCKMVKLGKRKEEEAIAYSQVQVLDSAGIRTYFPADLVGYLKDGVAYKTFIEDGNAVFAKCLVEGPAALFYHPGGYGEGETRNGKRYFFKKKGEQGFVEINSITTIPKWVGVPEIPAAASGGTYSGGNGFAFMPLKRKDILFIDFFSEYLKDCQGVVRKIKMEFYTLDDIQAVFQEFNTCKPAG